MCIVFTGSCSLRQWSIKEMSCVGDPFAQPVTATIRPAAVTPAGRETWLEGGWSASHLLRAICSGWMEFMLQHFKGCLHISCPPVASFHDWVPHTGWTVCTVPNHPSVCYRGGVRSCTLKLLRLLKASKQDKSCLAHLLETSVLIQEEWTGLLSHLLDCYLIVWPLLAYCLVFQHTK